MIMNRVWAMPNRNTFSIKPIGEFVNKYLLKSKISIDPYARDTKLATYTNDLNPNVSAQYHLDAADFLDELIRLGVKADLVIFDPPYSPRQVKECYDGIGLKMKQSDALRGFVLGKIKEKVNRVLDKHGVFLWFGWNTNGMGRKYDFEIQEILLVSHGSDHNDTICMAERRVSAEPLD